jgi:hypothetical protein
MATLPVKFGQLVDPAVATQFRQGAWLPSVCRWCEGPTRRSGAGCVCALCDAAEGRR